MVDDLWALDSSDDDSQIYFEPVRPSIAVIIVRFIFVLVCIFVVHPHLSKFKSVPHRDRISHSGERQREKDGGDYLANR